MSFAFNRGVGSKKIGMQFSFDIPVTMHFQKFSRPGDKSGKTWRESYLVDLIFMFYKLLVVF